MNVSFEEIGRLAVTFAQTGCEGGQVCKVSPCEFLKALLPLS